MSADPMTIFERISREGGLRIRYKKDDFEIEKLWEFNTTDLQKVYTEIVEHKKL